MSYVLSVIHPPVAPAAFGQATITEEVISADHAADVAGDVLIRMEVPTMAARRFGTELAQLGTGTAKQHPGTGVSFRIDPADEAPHPCPCCGRLVLPTDHADAAMEDAYCTGCFTWERNVPQCLPANTAHTEEP